MTVRKSPATGATGNEIEEMNTKNLPGSDTVTDSDGNGTTVPAKKSDRIAVVFIGPYHRYSRGDVACFERKQAEDLVTRKIACWPKDKAKALAPKPGDTNFDTDIG